MGGRASWLVAGGLALAAATAWVLARGASGSAPESPTREAAQSSVAEPPAPVAVAREAPRSEPPTRAELTTDPVSPGAVQGLVLWDSGMPAAGATITLRPRWPWRGPRRSGAVLFDGRFRVDGLPPGDIGVEAAHDDAVLKAVARIGVRPGAVTDAGVLRLARGLELRGRVLTESAPGGGVRPRVGAGMAQVWAIAEDGGHRTGTIGDDGAFGIEGLGPGLHHLLLWDRSARAVRGDLAQAGSSDTELVVTTGGARVAGAVRAEDGRPVPDSVVEVRERHGPRWFRRTRVKGSTDGSFVLRRLPPGRYWLALSAPGFVDRVTDPLDVGHDGLVERVETMRREIAVPGRIIETDGRPLAGARIAVMRFRVGVTSIGELLPIDLSALGDLVETATGDADGRFTLLDGDDDDVLVCRADGFAVHDLLRRDVQRDGTIAITLSRGVAVTGRLAGLPPTVPAGTVELYLGRRLDRISHEPLVATPAADGTFRFERVPPGDWILGADDGDPLVLRRFTLGDTPLGLGPVPVPE
jgi:hypothetical protein